MPKPKAQKELTEWDVQEVCKSLVADFGCEDIEIHITPSGYYPFKVVAQCWLPDEVDRRLVWSHDFYTTVRYPSIPFVCWKAVNSLYTKCQRMRDGLPPEL